MDRQALVTAVGTAFQRYQRGVEAVDDAVAVLLGINRTDLRAIDVLTEGPKTAGELAGHVGLSPAAMTTSLDRLERKNYIRRVRDAHDRRKVLVEITDRAVRLTRECLGPVAAEASQVLDRFGEDELSRFVELLNLSSTLYDRHLARLRAGAAT